LKHAALIPNVPNFEAVTIQPGSVCVVATSG
jgi:hypothetical protein